MESLKFEGALIFKEFVGGNPYPRINISMQLIWLFIQTSEYLKIINFYVLNKEKNLPPFLKLCCPPFLSLLLNH